MTIDINDLDERLCDVEDWAVGSDNDIQVMLDNQLAIAQKINEIIEYTSRLFQTGIEPLTITIHEPEGDEDDD